MASLAFINDHITVLVISVSLPVDISRRNVQWRMKVFFVWVGGGGGLNGVAAIEAEPEFSYAGPVVWNNLPMYIRAEPDIARFKNT